VLQSITKPLRVTMKGNNGKEYPFLVKYGDDLKQDRRIQQLFRISNRLFDEDCRTHDRKLNLETYAVSLEKIQLCPLLPTQPFEARLTIISI
jgi:DNA-dependent protein kinase catalytic subunit